MGIRYKKYTKEWLSELCLCSNSIREVLIKAGRKYTGGNYSLLKDKIKEYNIDISHFTGQRWNINKTAKDDIRIYNQSIHREVYDVDSIFVKNSSVTQKVLRGYVIRHNLLDYVCSKCGCDGSWLDGKISLELHHIDGDNRNNLLENLEYLCPNCHALTSNYRGKNKGINKNKSNKN